MNTQCVCFDGKLYEYSKIDNMWRTTRKSAKRLKQFQRSTSRLSLPTSPIDDITRGCAKNILFTNENRTLIWDGKKRRSIRANDYVIYGRLKTANIDSDCKYNIKCLYEVIKYLTSSPKIFMKLLHRIVINYYYDKKKIIIFDYHAKPLYDILLLIFKYEYNFSNDKKVLLLFYTNIITSQFDIRKIKNKIQKMNTLYIIYDGVEKSNWKFPEAVYIRGSDTAMDETYSLKNPRDTVFTWFTN